MYVHNPGATNIRDAASLGLLHTQKPHTPAVPKNTFLFFLGMLLMAGIRGGALGCSWGGVNYLPAAPWCCADNVWIVCLHCVKVSFDSHLNKGMQAGLS